MTTKAGCLPHGGDTPSSMVPECKHGDIPVLSWLGAGAEMCYSSSDSGQCHFTCVEVGTGESRVRAPLRLNVACSGIRGWRGKFSVRASMLGTLPTSVREARDNAQDPTPPCTESGVYGNVWNLPY